MERTKLSSKGQVILPKAIRDARRWRSGTEFIVEDSGEGVLLRPAKTFKPSTLDEVVGCLRYEGKAKTLKEMDAAISAEVKARRARGRC
ncbi:MAG TPA: AbrB/MazE/SpoVT family DNA-binding domain-containing protein [Candidatus Binataceae bacterium]|nr:AbrB/MazE/SpoVT family DNA-binding domain-containing protein [Candidatus Binataceae bacterium]